MVDGVQHSGGRPLLPDSSRHPLAAWLGIAVAALGFAVTAGWWSGVEQLTRIKPQFTPMKPNAALGCILAGLSLTAWSRHPHRRRTRTSVQLTAFFLVGIGLLTLLENTTGVDLGIDRLLLPTGGDAGAAQPGRMAQMSAVTFVVAGVALVALVRSSWNLVHLCALTVWAIGYVALLGYTYGVAALYQVGAYTQMSIHMAAAACLLGLGLELSVTDHGAGVLVRDAGAAGRIARTLIPAFAVTIPLVGWVVLRGERQGWYESEFTAAIIASTVGVLGSALAIFAAMAALRSEERQTRVRAELEALAETLEDRVIERTRAVATVARDLSTVFDAAPVGMVRLRADGSCFAVNAEWCLMSGIDEQTCVGDGWSAAIHPGDRSELVRAVRGAGKPDGICRLLTSAGPRTTAYAVRAVNDGEGRHVGYIATYADVHVQAEALRALHDARARIAAAFHASSLGIALVALDGTVLEANDRLGGLVMRRADALVGTSLSALLAPEYAATEADVRSSLLSRERRFGRFEARLETAADRVRWVLANVALVPAADGAEYFVTEFEDITARKLIEADLAHTALHDALTGLPGRLLLLDRLEHALLSAQRSGNSVSVLFVDIDRFKCVNDRLGHQAGDEVLRAVAQRILNTARPTDTVGRLGGDEFVLLCEGLRSAGDALRIGERCRRAIAAPNVLEGADISIDASIGIAFARDRYPDRDAMLRDADAAMYEAKARGRGRCIAFDERMRTW